MSPLQIVFENKFNEIYKSVIDKYTVLLQKSEDKEFALKYYFNEYLLDREKLILSKYKIFGSEFFFKIRNYKKLGFEYEEALEKTKEFFYDYYKDCEFLTTYNEFVNKSDTEIILNTAEYLVHSDFVSNFEQEFQFISYKENNAITIVEDILSFLKGLALIKNVVVEKNCYIAKNFIAKLCK